MPGKFFSKKLVSDIFGLPDFLLQIPLLLFQKAGKTSTQVSSHTLYLSERERER